jgi:hypothetical protein
MQTRVRCAHVRSWFCCSLPMMALQTRSCAVTVCMMITAACNPGRQVWDLSL